MKKRKMLLLLHCLIPGGAINVVVTLAEELQKLGYELVVISCNEGEARNQFEKLGIPVAVRNDLQEETFLTEVTENYDEVLVNTLLMFPVVNKLNQKNILVHWWIHEPPLYFKALGEEISSLFWNGLGEKVRVYTAGDFVHDWLKEIYGYDSFVLNFGIEDMAEQVEKEDFQEISTDKITFLIPSVFIQYVKGQDIMVEAVLGLPEEYVKKAEFLFLGGDGDDKEFHQLVSEKMLGSSNMKLYGPVKHEMLLCLMNQVDCIVAPSREDATNACIVEGLMLSKVCLCSDKAGISRYMEDCINGFIFPSGSVEELRARIMLIIDNFPRIKAVGENGRKVYEKCFSMETFRKNVKKYWEKREEEEYDNRFRGTSMDG